MTRNYSNFKMELIDELNMLLPDAEIAQVSIEKNNNMTLEGIRIGLPGSSLAPVFYPHQIYDNGATDPAQVASYISAQVQNEAPFDSDLTDKITDFNWVKNRLFIKLVNTERNAEALKSMPHTGILDLAATYIVVLNDSFDATVTVKDSLFETWTISVEDLHAAALENTARYGIQIRAMNEILANMLSEDEAEDTPPFSMYVLNNPSGIFGASAILLPEAEDLISAKVGDHCYAIPSSIHEWILLPLDVTEDTSGIADIIRQVNSSTVGEDEVLGDHLYIYSCGKLSVV